MGENTPTAQDLPCGGEAPIGNVRVIFSRFLHLEKEQNFEFTWESFFKTERKSWKALLCAALAYKSRLF